MNREDDKTSTFLIKANDKFYEARNPDWFPDTQYCYANKAAPCLDRKLFYTTASTTHSSNHIMMLPKPPPLKHYQIEQKVESYKFGDSMQIKSASDVGSLRIAMPRLTPAPVIKIMVPACSKNSKSDIICKENDVGQPEFAIKPHKIQPPSPVVFPNKQKLNETKKPYAETNGYSETPYASKRFQPAIGRSTLIRTPPISHFESKTTLHTDSTTAFLKANYKREGINWMSETNTDNKNTVKIEYLQALSSPARILNLLSAVETFSNNTLLSDVTVSESETKPIYTIINGSKNLEKKCGLLTKNLEKVGLSEGLSIKKEFLPIMESYPKPAYYTPEFNIMDIAFAYYNNKRTTTDDVESGQYKPFQISLQVLTGKRQCIDSTLNRHNIGHAKQQKSQIEENPILIISKSSPENLQTKRKLMPDLNLKSPKKARVEDCVVDVVTHRHLQETKPFLEWTNKNTDDFELSQNKVDSMDYNEALGSSVETGLYITNPKRERSISANRIDCQSPNQSITSTMVGNVHVASHVHSFTTDSLAWKIEAMAKLERQRDHLRSQATKAEQVKEQLQNPGYRKNLIEKAADVGVIRTMRPIEATDEDLKDIVSLIEIPLAKRYLRKYGAVLFTSKSGTYMPCTASYNDVDKIKLPDISHFHVKRLGNCTWIFSVDVANPEVSSLKTIGDFFKPESESSWCSSLKSKEIEYLAWKKLRSYVDQSNSNFLSSLASNSTVSLMSEHKTKQHYNTILEKSRYMHNKWSKSIISFAKSMIHVGDILTFLPLQKLGPMYSTNTILRGGNIIWYTVPAKYVKFLEEKLNKFLEPHINDDDCLLHKGCKVPISHKLLMVDIAWYIRNKIPLKRFVQEKFSTIVFNPGCVFFGINVAANVCESTFICQDSSYNLNWLCWNAFSPYCEKLETNDKEDIEPYVYEFFHDRYHDYIHGNLHLNNPYTEKLERVRSPGFKTCSKLYENIIFGVSEVVAVKTVLLDDLNKDEVDAYEFDTIQPHKIRNTTMSDTIHYTYSRQPGLEVASDLSTEDVRIYHLVYIKMGNFAGWVTRNVVQTLTWNCQCRKHVNIPDKYFTDKNCLAIEPFRCTETH